MLSAYHPIKMVSVKHEARQNPRPAPHRLRRIEGRHNALVKELRQAFAHAERTEEGDCAIEGMRIVEEAIRSGLRFKAVFFKESAQNLAERLLPQIGANVDTLLLPDKLFDPAVPSETPQGVAALVRLKDFSLEMCSSECRLDRSSLWRACRIRAIWGQFCARPRLLAAQARCWARGR